MGDNNLKELVELLEKLKNAYIVEKQKGNVEKAEKIRIQILKLVEEIKNIKEKSQIVGETVNINKFESELKESNKEDKLELSEEENEFDEELTKDVDEENPIKTEDQQTKSLKEIKRELTQEKAKLKKIAKEKEKAKKLQLKEVAKKKKQTKKNIKRVEQDEKSKIRQTKKKEKQRRKDSQLKEVKAGTIVIFSLLIISLLLVIARFYINDIASSKIISQDSLRYGDMYRFFIMLFVSGSYITCTIFTVLHDNLIYRVPILVLILSSYILLFISFGMGPLKSFDSMDLIVRLYPLDKIVWSQTMIHLLLFAILFILPMILMIILIDFIGKNIFRDKVYYDYEYI